MKNKKQSNVLNAFLSRAGISSRRGAVELIKRGLVTVNNEVIFEPGYKVKASDIVRFKDKEIKPEKKVYILLNKPKGFVTTLSDELQRHTVLDLVKSATHERIFPVGRLDRDTTGLILLTNDGDLSQKLAHPKHKISKRYYVVLDRPIQLEDMQQLKKGIILEDGRVSVDRIYHPEGKGKTHVIVEIHMGKKRIIKRMFSHLNYKVINLDRFYYAGLTKRGLPVGRWRLLTQDEIENLKNI